MNGIGFRSAREALGLTQAAAADLLGVSKATVYSWECRGVKIPEPAAKLIRLCVESPELLGRIEAL